MRTGEAAISWGRTQVDAPVKDFRRLCLQFVRMSFDLPAVYPDAGTAWDRAQFRHRTDVARNIPRGVPVFFELPSVADHVALSLGAGMCLSNDVKRAGRIDVVSIGSIVTSWGAELLGWTEDLNGQRVYTAPAPEPRPTRVRRARGHMVEARRELRTALQLLEATPDVRRLVHDEADKLDGLIVRLSRRIDRLPEQ